MSNIMTAEDISMQVLCTAQQTITCFNCMKQHCINFPAARVRTSATPFNRQFEDAKLQWKQIACYYNVQASHPKIYEAIYKLIYKIPRITGYFDEVADDDEDPYKGGVLKLIPLQKSFEYVFNKLDQNQIDKIKEIIKHLEKENTNKLNRVAKNIRIFIDLYENINPKSIRSFDDWHQFLSDCKIPENWTDNLDIKNILKSFGVKPEILSNIDKEIIEQINADSLKWLSKALNSYRIIAPINDIVNMIFIVMQYNPKKYHTQQQILSVILEFDNLITKKFNKQYIQKNFWLPDIFIHDGELDDIIAYYLLEHVCGMVEHQFLGIAQIPNPECDEIKNNIIIPNYNYNDQVLAFRCYQIAWEQQGVHTFIDSNIKNIQTLAELYNFNELYKEYADIIQNS